MSSLRFFWGWLSAKALPRKPDSRYRIYANPPELLVMKPEAVQLQYFLPVRRQTYSSLEIQVTEGTP